MQATIKGTSRVDGKSSSVNLNYTHDENVFTLWRSLRFGDNLQTGLSNTLRFPVSAVRLARKVRNNNEKMAGALTVAALLTGCTPRIEVAAPKEPITINMNVKIEHEIHIKVDKDVEALLKSRSDLF